MTAKLLRSIDLRSGVPETSSLNDLLSATDNSSQSNDQEIEIEEPEDDPDVVVVHHYSDDEDDKPDDMFGSK